MNISKRRRSSRIWKPKTSTNITIDNIDDDDLQGLKSTTKKISIVSRLQSKQKNHSSFKNRKPRTAEKRPQTSNIENINSLTRARRAYVIDQKTNEKLLTTNNPTEASTYIKTKECVKEGLLGEYEKYERMSKRQLIEKLISLEYLANNIFRKNKVLEQRIQKLEKS